MDDFALQVLRLALPLILATLAEVISERSGTVNLGIEGMMLAGAFAAYSTGAGEGPGMLLAAWSAAALVGMGLGGVLAYWTIERHANQIVTGTAIHFLALGTTGLLFERFKQAGAVTTFQDLAAPWNLFPYCFTAAAVVVLWLLFRSTRMGLHLKAAGDSPGALLAAGISAHRSRWFGLLLAGALAGVSGATLTTVLTGQFVEGMTAGRGFLALSLVLFARWHPVGAVAAGLFLGVAFAFELHFATWAAQRTEEHMLVFLIRVSPYALTIVALTVVRPERLQAPRALGKRLPDSANL